jgi:hypothetical protein
MHETASMRSTEDHGHPHPRTSGSDTAGRRLLRRPTVAETAEIARECPSEGLSIQMIVHAIRRETGCSRATAYRAVAGAFAAGILSRTED